MSTPAKALAAARQGDPEPARFLHQLTKQAKGFSNAHLRRRMNEWCARIAEKVALNDYGYARNLAREAELVGINLPKAYKEI